MSVKIKVVSLEKAKEIDNIFCDMWPNFPPLYFLSEGIFGEGVFGKEFIAEIAPEKVTIPWFCYFTENGWYIPNIYVETAEEL